MRDYCACQDVHLKQMFPKVIFKRPSLSLHPEPKISLVLYILRCRLIYAASLGNVWALFSNKAQ